MIVDTPILRHHWLFCQWENLVGKYHISTSLYLARIHIFFDKFLCLKYTNFKNDVMESYPKILETLDQKPLHTFWRLNRA